MKTYVGPSQHDIAELEDREATGITLTMRRVVTERFGGLSEEERECLPRKLYAVCRRVAEADQVALQPYHH